jgi:hypothetical protein
LAELAALAELAKLRAGFSAVRWERDKSSVRADRQSLAGLALPICSEVFHAIPGGGVLVAQKDRVCPAAYSSVLQGLEVVSWTDRINKRQP